jgi:gluconokinase
MLPVDSRFRLVMGVDIGTSSTKAMATDRSGQVLAVCQKSYPLVHPKPGWVELDPAQVLDAARDAMRSVFEQLQPNDFIACISFSTAMHGLMAVDQKGKPLTNLLTWADTRSVAEVDDIRLHSAFTELYAHTGLPLHPMSPLCKIRWMQKNRPEMVAETRIYVGFKEYLLFQMTGGWEADYASAAAMGMLDIREKTWYPPALELAGITAQQLPALQDPLHAYTISANELARFLGLDPAKHHSFDGNEPRPVKLVLGCTDGPLANLGSGAMDPGLLALTIGTSGAVRITVPEAIKDPGGRLFSYPFLPGCFTVGGPVNNGGVIIKWFTENILQRPFKEASDFNAFLDEAMTVPPGAEGLICLPWLMGERAPIWNANASGIFIGLQMHHGRAHMMRSLVEGICFSLKQIAGLLEENGCFFESIYASGGFTASTHWVQMIADIFQKSVYFSQESDASARGAAILGWMHLEEKIDPNAFASWQEKRTLCSPSIKHRASYQKAYHRFQQLVEKYGKEQHI